MASTPSTSSTTSAPSTHHSPACGSSRSVSSTPPSSSEAKPLASPLMGGKDACMPPTTLTADQLEERLAEVLAAPADLGTLDLLVCRPSKGERRLLESGLVDLELGLVGDNWPTRPSRSTPDRRPDPAKQITVISARLSALLSADPERRALTGDQLHVDLDLSVENLPAGSRLAVGAAVLEISAAPHRGCAVFVGHFGEEAMRFVNGRTGRGLRLRGLNASVVVPGTVRVGDVVRRL